MKVQDGLSKGVGAGKGKGEKPERRGSQDVLGCRFKTNACKRRERSAEAAAAGKSGETRQKCPSVWPCGGPW